MRKRTQRSAYQPTSMDVFAMQTFGNIPKGHHVLGGYPSNRKAPPMNLATALVILSIPAFIFYCIALHAIFKF